MRSPTLLPIRMNAADTSASRAIADWTPLTVVSRSRTTAEIDTFISDVSTTSTNIAIASRMARRGLPDVVSGAAGAPGSVIDSGERSGRASRAEDPLLLGEELLFAEHALALQLAELPQLLQLGVHVVGGRRGGLVGRGLLLVGLLLVGLLLVGLLFLAGPPVGLPPRDAVGHGRGRPGDHGGPCDTSK